MSKLLESPKIETGIMVMKNDMAWGVTYKDGQSTSYGWVRPEDALIFNAEFCKRPEDVTYSDSSYIKELQTGALVQVERRTIVTIKN
jgi:hypothetical protein